jgi:hypothetical protein
MMALRDEDLDDPKGGEREREREREGSRSRGPRERR